MAYAPSKVEVEYVDVFTRKVLVSPDEARAFRGGALAYFRLRRRFCIEDIRNRIGPYDLFVLKRIRLERDFWSPKAVEMTVTGRVYRLKRG